MQEEEVELIYHLRRVQEVPVAEVRAIQVAEQTLVLQEQQILGAGAGVAGAVVPAVQA
jgi:hypothetical protein